MESMTTAALEKQLVRLIQCQILPQTSYLAGGTAVYYYLRHRLSVDLDFFTDHPFSAELFLDRIRGCFNEVNVESLEQDTLILLLSPQKIKFSLFHYPYRLLLPAVAVSLGEGAQCPLASLQDIAAMKAVAINQRGSIKDFIDLYSIIRKIELDFNQLSRLVIDKYRLDSRYEYQLRTALVYFDDADREQHQILMLSENGEGRQLTDQEWVYMKRFFEKWVP
jgi:predicted nucleotidyltransferase component of viral defense system